MAVSIANTLTPHLWKGEPKVVIRGRFVLGLVVSGNNLYYAPNLSLADIHSYAPMAIPVDGAAGLTVQVLGRAVVGSNNSASVDGPVYSTAGFDAGRLDSFDTYVGYYSSLQSVRDMFPSDPYSNGTDAPFFAPKVFFSTYGSYTGHLSSGFDKSNSGEATAHTNASALGTLVAPNLRIVLRGALSSLDITHITAAGFPPGGNPDPQYGPGYTIATTPWSPARYEYSGYSPPGVGWRATDVHIYDNPWLRGHVTAGDVPVIWE